MPGQAPRARWEELVETGGPAARSLALRGGDGRAGVMPAWRNVGGTPSVSVALGAAPAPPPWAVVLTPTPQVHCGSLCALLLALGVLPKRSRRGRSVHAAPGPAAKSKRLPGLLGPGRSRLAHRP